MRVEVLSIADSANPNNKPCKSSGRIFTSLSSSSVEYLFTVSATIATQLIAYQEHRTRRRPGHRRRVCLMSMICFYCFRIRSHVSGSREFQNHPSLTEGYHVLDCTLITADDVVEPPATVCRHEPRATLGSTAQDGCSIETLQHKHPPPIPANASVSSASFHSHAKFFWSHFSYLRV